jgi:SAM-dependent MidA family methyltransferase
MDKKELWAHQRNYFEDAGVLAWKEVPFFITSNPNIACLYAKTTADFLVEAAEMGRLKPDAPIYILELGAGVGKFGFHFLTLLLDLLHYYPHIRSKICYVMTDFARKNVDFWKSQPQLASFIAQGYMDVALYDVTVNTPLYLECKGVGLTSSDFKNPLILVANYVFDSIPQDWFSLDSGRLSKADDISIKDGDDKAISCEFKEVPHSYYADPLLNDVLNSYIRDGINGAFSIPNTGILTLRHLLELANGQMLGLVGDWGDMEHVVYKGKISPRFSFFGYASLGVNFDALARALTGMGGEMITGKHQERFYNIVTLSQSLKEKMPKTKASFIREHDRLSPQEWVRLKQLFTAMDLSPEDALSVIALSGWDPIFLSSLTPKTLSDLFSSSSVFIKAQLKEALPKLEAHYYASPVGNNPAFDLARLSYLQSHFKQALHYYAASDEYQQRQCVVYFNMGLCAFYLKDYEKAKVYFGNAIEVDKEAVVNQPMNDDIKALVASLN